MLKVLTTIAILGAAVAAIFFNYQSTKNKPSASIPPDLEITDSETKPQRRKKQFSERKTKKSRAWKGVTTKSPAYRPGFKIESLDKIINKHAKWDYLAGVNLHPESDWTELSFDSSSWKKGRAGFGYGDNDDNTILKMMNKFTVVYIRKKFLIDDPAELSNIGIAAKYDDGFIAYLNGELVVRSIVDSGTGVDAKGFYKHEAKEYEYFSLDEYKKLLKKGKNVLAIEGHNESLDSTDFSLDVYLLGGNQS